MFFSGLFAEAEVSRPIFPQISGKSLEKMAFCTWRKSKGVAYHGIKKML
jgi:hypothetical protein